MKWIYATITLLVTLLIVLLLWNRMVITVYAGQDGVLFKRWGGTVVDKIYHEGIHIIFPWDIMTKYDVRIQKRKLEFSALSKQGLNIKVNVSVRFKPEIATLGILHQKIGPNYVDSVVIPEVKSVVRRYFGNYSDEEIYTSKGAILEKIRNDLSKRLSDNYIILDDLIITNIEFPEIVRKSIQDKIAQYHNYKAYEYKINIAKLESDRKVIEANGISKYKDIISKNITNKYLEWAGIQATVKLAESPNAKIIVIGSNKNGLPLILNTESNSSNEN